MSGKRWAGVLAAVALAAGVGCVNQRWKGYQESLCCPEPPTPVPPPVRNQVVVFLMNGYDPLETVRMLLLRNDLTRAGFPQVYVAQRPDVGWYRYELHRVARDQPGCRIVLAGYGGAADKVVLLAQEAARDMLPVDSVVFLDPLGARGDLSDTLPFPSLVIRSHHWRGGGGLSASEVVNIPQGGHYSLPTHPGTEDVLLQLLTAAASRVHLEPPHLPLMPLTDKPAPTPRGIDPATLVGPLDEWDFLKPGLPFPPVRPGLDAPAGAAPCPALPLLVP